MKKIMSLMLGMSLVLGSASLVFGQDKKDSTSTDTSKKAKKAKKAKKTDTTDTTKK